MTAPSEAIPFVDLRRQIDGLRLQLDAAMARVVEQGDFVRGGPCRRFEEAFGRYLGVRHVVCVASGTDALALSMAALGVGPGHEVLVPANSFPATAAAVLTAGATPVFVDVDRETLNMDMDAAEDRISRRTRAIIPVHLHGNPADMAGVLRVATHHKLKVVEDAAQAHGAIWEERRVGGIGNAGCFSFYPSKNLGAFGDGGAVTTNDLKVAEWIRRVRDHGRNEEGRHVVVGQCSRLDTLQAAVLGCKLPHLDRWNERRRDLARRYVEALAGCPGLRLVETSEGAVFHHFVVRTTLRDALARNLADRGIGTGVHYPRTIPQEPAYAGYRAQPTPEADHSAHEVLSLPMFPELTMAEVDRVADAIWDFVKNY